MSNSNPDTPHYLSSYRMFYVVLDTNIWEPQRANHTNNDQTRTPIFIILSKKSCPPSQRARRFRNSDWSWRSQDWSLSYQTFLTRKRKMPRTLWDTLGHSGTHNAPPRSLPQLFKFWWILPDLIWTFYGIKTFSSKSQNLIKLSSILLDWKWNFAEET